MEKLNGEFTKQNSFEFHVQILAGPALANVKSG